MIAVAKRNGVIEFRRALPKRAQAFALPIASGDIKVLRPAIAGLARQGYDGKTLLVPGLPEAPNDKEALVALERFCTRVRDAMRRVSQKAHRAS